MKVIEWTWALIAVSFSAGGCGADDQPAVPGGPGSGGHSGCGTDAPSLAGTTGEFPGETPADTACGALVTREPVPAGPALHVPACSALTFASNPPSSGNHYGRWAEFRESATPVPRGYWVHSLEHRAVVIAYNCSDCEAEVEAARAWIETLPEDPVCAPYAVARRVILTPDPLLDVPWAAAAWGYTLRSQCFEPGVFSEFFLAHSAEGPENICAPP